ncbi:MAG: SDR family NAD(P)-dependent oxidoreductase [Bacteroides sp.]|nr:SDR family NAD(P)-dependent oxidoreductase [Bacteroides sp.]
MKRAVIMGATSGIGKEVARILLKKGWMLGVAGRRSEELKALKELAPDQVETEVIDVTDENAPEMLNHLIEKIGGIDIYFHSSGIGKQNPELEEKIEIDTLRINGEGFTRMVTGAYRYFRTKGGGHIAVISSIAGTKGLGAAPAYSATKRFQNTYTQALSQLSHMEKAHITFTDIRPGFVKTDLLKEGNYPMLMQPDKVAQSIVKALSHKKRVKIIDNRYAVLVFFWRMIPGFIWERLPIQAKKKK